MSTTIGAGSLGRGRNPVHAVSGAFYQVIHDLTANDLKMMKASDPTSSWSEVDSAGAPTNEPQSTGWLISVADSTYIHVAVLYNNYTYYSRFDHTSDAWDNTIVDEEITTPGSTAAFRWASIAVRSDGDVIICYSGASEAVKGDQKQRVDYMRRESGSWTYDIALDGGGDEHYGNPNCDVGTNDGIHFVWQNTDDPANDPPVSWITSGLSGALMQARTLDSSNNLSTTVTDVGDTTAGNLLGIPNIVSLDNSGSELIKAFGWQPSITANNFYEDASDDIAYSSNYGNSLTPAVRVADEMAAMCLAVDGTVPYLAYVSGTNQDIYWTKTNVLGSSWDTPTVLESSVTGFWCSAAVFARGAATVLGVTWNTITGVEYSEYVIDAGATTATATINFSATLTVGGGTQFASATATVSATLAATATNLASATATTSATQAGSGTNLGYATATHIGLLIAGGGSLLSTATATTSGDLSAIGQSLSNTVTATATCTVSATLAATGTNLCSATSTVSGDLVAIGTSLARATIYVLGDNGSTGTILASTTINAVGTLAAIGQGFVYPTATATTTGDLVAAATNLISATATVIGDSVATGTNLASATATEAGDLAAGGGTQFASATINVIGDLAAIGVDVTANDVYATATITAIGDLVAGGGTQFASATINVAGDLVSRGTSLARATIYVLGDQGSYATILASATATTAGDLAAVGKGFVYAAATCNVAATQSGYGTNLASAYIAGPDCELTVGGGQHVASATATTAGDLAAIGTDVTANDVFATATINVSAALAASGTQLASGTATTAGDLAAVVGTVIVLASATITVGSPTITPSFITLRGVGSMYESPTHGTSGYALNKPARQAGDLLVVALAGTGSAAIHPTEVGTWSSYVGTQVAIYWRIATNDSDDDFTLDSFGSTTTLTGQMAAFEFWNSEPYDTVQAVGGGTLLQNDSTYGTEWPISGFGEYNANNPTLTIAWAFKTMNVDTTLTGVTDGYPGNVSGTDELATIDKTWFNGSGNDPDAVRSSWFLWTYWTHNDKPATAVTFNSADHIEAPESSGFEVLSQYGVRLLITGASAELPPGSGLELSAVGTNLASATATVSGNLAAIGTQLAQSASATVNVIGDLTAVGKRIVYGAGTINVSATAAAVGTSLARATVYVLGDNGSYATILGSGQATVSATLAAIGQNILYPTSATINVAGTLAGIGTNVRWPASATINLAGQLVVGGGLQVVSATLSTAGSLTADGYGFTPATDASATISVSSALDAYPTGYTPIKAYATINISVTLSAVEDPTDDVVLAKANIYPFSFGKHHRRHQYVRVQRSDESNRVTYMGETFLIVPNGTFDEPAAYYEDGKTYVRNITSGSNPALVIDKASIGGWVLEHQPLTGGFSRPYGIRHDDWWEGDEWELLKFEVNNLSAKGTIVRDNGNWLAYGSINVSASVNAYLKAESKINPTATISVIGATLAAFGGDLNYKYAKATINVSAAINTTILTFWRAATISTAGELTARGYLVPQGGLGMTASYAKASLPARAGPGTIDGQKKAVILVAYGSVQLYNNSHGGFYSIGDSAIVKESFGTMITTVTLGAVGSKDQIKYATGSMNVSASVDAVGTTNLPTNMIIAIGDLTANGEHTGITGSMDVSATLTAPPLELVIQFNLNNHTINDFNYIYLGTGRAHYRLISGYAQYKKFYNSPTSWTSYANEYIDPKDDSGLKVRFTRLSGDSVPNYVNPGLGSWLNATTDPEIAHEAVSGEGDRTITLLVELSYDEATIEDSATITLAAYSWDGI